MLQYVEQKARCILVRLVRSLKLVYHLRASACLLGKVDFWSRPRHATLPPVSRLGGGGRAPFNEECFIETRSCLLFDKCGICEVYIIF